MSQEKLLTYAQNSDVAAEIAARFSLFLGVTVVVAACLISLV
ncbi:hypothetical protein IMCC21906_00645 [Spongiibacter sp. IMCC21906]|jgi:hypothetical protein|nr:hypothetical protein [Spongiibacter sp. IMCC21906]AKH68338.1 hypothetical protein IMCC21906_00645 [Spongiibacter sp. IMCC21906]